MRAPGSPRGPGGALEWPDDWPGDWGRYLDGRRPRIVPGVGRSENTLGGGAARLSAAALGIGRRSAPRAESTFINFVWEALRERGRGAEREREGASERGREGGRRGGGSRGEEGRRPAPPIARSCKRASGAFPGAWRCVRAPFCSNRGGGCGPRGRKRGGRGRAAGGRRPPSKPPAKCSGLQKQAASSAEQAARPGVAGQRRGCWWAPVPSARGSGSPCPCGAGPPGTSGFPACPRLDALGLAAASAQGFESGPWEGARLGRPPSGGPAANMLRKGELEPQGQVGVGYARGRAASLGAARELPGAGAPGPGSSSGQSGGLCGDAPAEEVLLEELSPRLGPVARHGICSLDQAATPRDLARRGHFETTVSCP